MDLYCYKLKYILFFVIIFFGCDSIIEDEVIHDESEFEIITFYTDYDNQENALSVYLEVSENIGISLVSAIISNPNNSEIISSFDLINSNINDNIFLYEGSLLLSDDIYIYDINIIINFENQNEGYSFTDQVTTPVSPQISDYTITETHQLDLEEWTLLPIDIQVSDLNGFNNIESVTYQIKRALSGCDVECDYDDNCNEPISDSDYISDPTWIFSYLESSNDDNDYSYQYHVDIPMRPLNGSALYDENGEIIFGASDCGRIGTVFFKFSILDKDGLSHDIIDIPLEIIE